MSILARALERPLEPRRARYVREVESLMRAALRVLARRGYAAATVAEVLEEAALSTRAFYRHFSSKNELFLAVLERESEATGRRLRERLAGVQSPRERLEGWIEELLSLGYERRRARRTQVFLSDLSALQSAYPSEFVAISEAVHEPLLRVLEEGRADGTFPAAHPEDDARSIYAVTWRLVEARLEDRGRKDVDEARAHVLRFCLPALGAAISESERVTDRI